MHKLRFVAPLLLTATALAADAPPPLSAVKTFMYQLQNLEDPKELAALAASPYDMLVIEPTATTKDNATFDMKAMVQKLRTKPDGSRRLILAYLNAGQAESYRTYWDPSWKAPTKTSHGTPDFLLTPDPDGWSDNYPVAFWDQRWQNIIATDKNSQVSLLMNAGFDGLYLDWIDAWDYDPCTAEAQRQHVNPATAMVDFLTLIRTTARQINPHAVIIQQNAFTLLDADPRLPNAIDGLGVEDTWFHGKSSAKWTSKSAGDLPNKDKGDSSTPARLTQYQEFLALGKPVFTIDYCVNEKNAAQVYKDAHAHHLIPLVTRVSLDHLTTTPPP